MPGKVVQTRLELPARKARSTRTPCKSVISDDTEETVKTPRASRAKVLVPVADPEKIIRTPRGGRKKVSGTPAKSPLKRVATDSLPEAATQGSVSPTKQAKTPAKTPARHKENVRPGVTDSPCSSLARLALVSPRQPLGEAKRTVAASPVKKTNLFSPNKLTTDSIADLLDSPKKTSRTPSKARTPSRPSLAPSPTKSLFPTASPRRLTSSQLEDLLCSPKNPVKSQQTMAPAQAKNLFASPSKPAPRLKAGRSPVPKSPRPPLLPTKTLFPTASPRKITCSQLEDLLCSPLKSPLPTRSPRKPQTPSKLLTPVKRTALFSPAKKVSTPPPPPTLFHADVSQFQTARAALHTGTPSHLLCRENQVAEMNSWLDRHLGEGRPGSMYVSGAPGTGKTATLTHLLDNKSFNYKSIFINCMVLKSSIAIYREVAKQLNPGKTPKTEKDALKVIESAITTGDHMTLLVLDEVDQLESKDQAVLYTVFEWPALQGSNLALVGIANSLDLTERVLPRLQVKAAYKPTLLHYAPYTKQQIIDILSARLSTGVEKNSTPVITPRAIAFLAGKISSLSGDLRKALDVCRRALELAETLARKQTLLKPMTPRGMNSPSKSPRKGYKNPKALPQIGQVDMPQIMKVINQVYGSQVTASLGTKGEGLPVQQKVLIASLLLMVKKGRTKEVTLGKLIDTYSKVLKKRNMKPELESSCVGMIEMLESRGMVSYQCKGAPRMAKVCLRMDEDEVGQAFGDKAMLAGIVEDVTCIVR